MTKNDVAWKKLFEKYQILEEVNKNGLFKIEASQINQERESRLMAKFDHVVNLPEIFKENCLSILPISRSQYIIGHFNIHLPVKYNSKFESIPWQFPREIETIDYTNLYSESSALLCVFNIGIIDDLVNSKTKFTVSGRMSTGTFDFYIKNSINNQSYSINVANSQCEIDAGFETDDRLILIEAKNYKVEDFLIRQLYYPYRLWSKKISKRVVPVLMTYSNDIFSFFIYEFVDISDYNSITLVENKNYVIASEKIQISDIEFLLDQIKIIPEPPKIPFPQANKFERLIDLISLLLENDLTSDEITENYQFDERQTYYYTSAGKYLELITKQEKTFTLTNQAKDIFCQRHKLKYLKLIEKILEHEVFNQAFKLSLEIAHIPSKKQIIQLLSENHLKIGDKTRERRASTVKSWIDWIWSQID
ncbi:MULTISPECIES: type II restriction enzyme [Okeania]|uniref:Translation elongation factor n=1 Tax=Okeania hirsuta TaxID=1458930 RepID=A0A3N6QCH4_9CYAN|nr:MULTISPECIES: translation elongation factor [Okeania]NES79367.1 translation elongation factor [Okeania sp. SIO1H4]NET23381.1 translation elongation factor [Okeania sp. SIO1H5]NET78608.1 translation elongation factor [Okeania sp. SIO1F9]NET96522.1 translation elongation factor [Okeania sp. SIO1H2]RQH12970.1 translation elongation factor [Okeania hirsuta]